MIGSKQYSLARGVLETEPANFVTPSWFFVDDTLSFKVADDRVVQLTGLQSFMKDRAYQWSGLACSSDMTQIMRSAGLLQKVE